MAKNLPTNAGDVRDMGSIPESGRSLGGGHGNPVQYSCLENPVDRGAWQATVHRDTKSQTELKQPNCSMHTCRGIFDCHNLVRWGWGAALLASSGCKSKMLLHTLQCTDLLPHNKESGFTMILVLLYDHTDLGRFGAQTQHSAVSLQFPYKSSWCCGCSSLTLLSSVST